MMRPRNRWQIFSSIKIVSVCCNQISDHFLFALQCHAFCHSTDFTQLILTGTVQHWKGKLEEARKKWKSKKEADKKEKEQKRAEDITRNNKRTRDKRTVTTRILFTPEDNRLEKFNQKKV